MHRFAGGSLTTRAYDRACPGGPARRPPARRTPRAVPGLTGAALRAVPCLRVRRSVPCPACGSGVPCRAQLAGAAFRAKPGLRVRRFVPCLWTRRFVPCPPGRAWTRPESNRPPPLCESGALPDELRARVVATFRPSSPRRDGDGVKLRAEDSNPHFPVQSRACCRVAPARMDGRRGSHLAGRSATQTAAAITAGRARTSSGHPGAADSRRRSCVVRPSAWRPRRAAPDAAVRTGHAMTSASPDVAMDRGDGPRRSTEAIDRGDRP